MCRYSFEDGTVTVVDELPAMFDKKSMWYAPRPRICGSSFFQFTHILALYFPLPIYFCIDQVFQSVNIFKKKLYSSSYNETLSYLGRIDLSFQANIA